GEDQPVDVSRFDLAHIIEARVEEIFSLILQEIKRSGYDGLLPAGLVLTGGSSQLTGIRQLASQVMGMPVRVARPENLTGMVDQLHSPAYATSVGLLQYAMRMQEVDPSAVVQPKYIPTSGNPINWDRIKDVLKRFLP
ncbi:MAG: rod shape-determining protein, partial [Anaerolineales bacterium]